MITEKITSLQNPLIKRFRAARDGREPHLMFIEGIRLTEEAINAGVHIESIIYSDRLYDNPRGADLFEAFKQLRCRGAYVTEPVINSVSSVEMSQGVAAIAFEPHYELSDVIDQETTLLVIAHQLQDPGNLGTIIRAAEAAGADGVVVTRATTDPFRPKALRASMGSAFRLPIATHAPVRDVIKKCAEYNIPVIATDTRARYVYTELNLVAPVAILFGQEGSGLGEDVSFSADLVVKIPIAESVESLNVATAAAIILFEAARQRGFKFKPSEQKARAR